VRLVFADFDGDEGAVGVGDVGRVGGDDFEFLAGDGGKKVSLEEADMVGKTETLGVEPSNIKGPLGDVDCGDIRSGPLVGDADGYATGTGTDVENSRRPSG